MKNMSMQKKYFQLALEYNYDDGNEEEDRYNYLISLEACLDRQTLHAIQHKYNDQNDSDYQTEIEGIFNENKTNDTH